MRKDKIVKMAAAAVAAAYMAVLPVQAEENGEENIEESTAGESSREETGWESQEEEDQGEGQPPEGSQAESGDGACSSPDPDGESQEDEAWYSAMGILSGGEILKEMTEVERIIWRKENYGPHMLLVSREEEKEPEPEPAAYSEEDLYVLAHAICGEGQGYPDEEQLYIGSVILNRRAHSAYPDSIEGVVFQKGQYACTRDGNYYREPTEANWRNAKWLLENGSILPANVVYQAGFRQGSGIYAQTRYHKYCYR